MRKILILISLVLFSALSFGQGAMMGSVGASGGASSAAEMFSYTDFSSGWGPSGDFSTGGDSAYSAGTQDYSFVRQLDGAMVSSIEADTDYTCSFTIGIGSARFALMSAGNAAEYVTYTIYTVGFHSVNFTSPSSVGIGGMQFRTDASGAFSLKNPSLKPQ